MYVCMFVCMYMYVCMYVCMYVYIYKFIYDTRIGFDRLAISCVYCQYIICVLGRILSICDDPGVTHLVTKISSVKHLNHLSYNHTKLTYAQS